MGLFTRYNLGLFAKTTIRQVKLGPNFNRPKLGRSRNDQQSRNRPVDSSSGSQRFQLLLLGSQGSSLQDATATRLFMIDQSVTPHFKSIHIVSSLRGGGSTKSRQRTMLHRKLNTLSITVMISFFTIILILSVFLEFPFSTISVPSGIESHLPITSNPPEPFTNMISAFKKWDSSIGCAEFREIHKGVTSKNRSSSSSLQEGIGNCGSLKMDHVNILIKGWTWIPDNLDNLYICECGLSCFWTKSTVLADKPDALLFETTTPPLQRRTGDPLRVYMDLEAGRKRSGVEDIFISYHAEDDVQSTYAGALFHNNRNYHISSTKHNDTLVYWSSSRCLPKRNELARKLLSLLPSHSFGKCLNNVGGLDMALTFYPECITDPNTTPKWWDHLHCSMSHYKFVLAIENTFTESYVTEKLFYALDSGAVPIYFGAPNVLDFVPPNSIIDGTKFATIEELASYVKDLANDPVAYAGYHAWRRCGVLGNYSKARITSLDTLPCRLCEAVSKRGGRNAPA